MGFIDLRVPPSRSWSASDRIPLEKKAVGIKKRKQGHTQESRRLFSISFFFPCKKKTVLEGLSNTLQLHQRIILVVFFFKICKKKSKKRRNGGIHFKYNKIMAEKKIDVTKMIKISGPSFDAKKRENRSDKKKTTRRKQRSIHPYRTQKLFPVHVSLGLLDGLSALAVVLLVD